jgi:hypothetical protein
MTQRLYDAKICPISRADPMIQYILDTEQYEGASFIRRFLQHENLNTKTKRMGRVIRITHAGMNISNSR